jgi:hypothetical protein
MTRDRVQQGMTAVGETEWGEQTARWSGRAGRMSRWRAAGVRRSGGGLDNDNSWLSGENGNQDLF